jgi:hypothetical protein
MSIIVTLNRTQPPLPIILHLSFLVNDIISFLPAYQLRWLIQTAPFSNGCMDLIADGHLELLLLCVIFPVTLFQEQ